MSSISGKPFVVAALFAASLVAQAQEGKQVVEQGKTVDFEYTLSLDDGSVVQTNQGAEPLSYVHGEGQILPALESAMEGMRVNEKKTVKLSPAEGYGEVNPEAFQEVPIDKLPEEARHVGAQLGVQGFDGPIRVAEVRDDVAVLDFNHPLAGKSLTFDVRIVGIR